MTEFVSFVVSVGGFGCAVILGSIWALLHPRSPTPRRLVLVLAIVYTVASVGATSDLAGRLLAAGYRPLESSDVGGRSSAIVLLGSGSVTAKDWQGNTFSVVRPSATSRVLEAFRVYSLVHPDWVISSGGLVHKTDTRLPSAITMRDALIQLGVPSARILVETESTNTHDESVIVRSMIAPLHVDRVILVTSQFHMRRSVGTFRAAGIDVVPAIARDEQSAALWREWLIPSERGLRQTNSVVHEVLGIPYYALRGWYR